VEVSVVEKLPDLLKLITKKGHELGILNKHSTEEEIVKASTLPKKLQVNLL
jgi:hypothetical protein